MKKRVLFVIESLSGGGAEKVLSTIVKNIDKTKFDITVLTVVKIGVLCRRSRKNIVHLFQCFQNMKN